MPAVYFVLSLSFFHFQANASDRPFCNQQDVVSSTIAQILPGSECLAQINSDECKAVYSELRDNNLNPEDYMLQCSASGLAKLEPELFAGGQMFMGCAIGAFDGGIGDFAKFLGETAAKIVMQVKIDNDCNTPSKSLENKKRLIRVHNQSVAKELQIEVPPDSRLQGYNCQEIRRFIFNEHRYLLTQLNRRMRVNVSDNPDKNIFEYAKGIIQQTGIKLSCYNHQKQAEMLCNVIATMAATASSPLALAKLAKASGINLAKLDELAELTKPPKVQALDESVRIADAGAQTSYIHLLEPAKRQVWRKFRHEYDDAFVDRLREFRGDRSLDFNPSLHGGEGQIFTSTTNPSLALKRFFKNKATDHFEGVDLLENIGARVRSNPELSKSIDVVKIHERGPDWILRDFNPNSVPLKSVIKNPEVKEARRAAINEIKKANDPELKLIRDYLDRNPISENIHWDPVTNRIFIIDLTTLELTQLLNYALL